MTFELVIYLPGIYPKEIVKDVKYGIKKRENKTIHESNNRKVLNH